MIVIDANIAMNWFLESPSTSADDALESVVIGGAIVPQLWRWEIQDVLRRLELSGRLNKPADFVRVELQRLPINVDNELQTIFGDEAAIAKRFNLTVYDAAYLELAIRVGVPLATTDKALSLAAKASNLHFEL